MKHNELRSMSVTIKFLKSAPQLPPEAGTSQSLPVRPSSSFYFDLNLARVSLLMNVACYTLIGFAPNSGVFIAFTLISSFAQGFSPALHGVALKERWKGEREAVWGVRRD